MDEEQRFLTPEVLMASSMIGTKEQLIEHICGMEEVGLDQIMILPNFDARYDVIEQVAKDIMPYV